MMNKFEKEDKYIEAQKRLKELKGFYYHFFWYLLVNLVIIIMVYINADDQYDFWNFGTFSTAFFWGIGLGFHAIGVFGKSVFFSKEWEKRKIKEFMDNDKL